MARPSGLKPDPLSKECVWGVMDKNSKSLHLTYLHPECYWSLTTHITISWDRSNNLCSVDFQISQVIDWLQYEWNLTMIFQGIAYIFRLLNHSLVHNGADFLHVVHIVVHHIFTRHRSRQPPALLTCFSQLLTVWSIWKPLLDRKCFRDRYLPG